jgi:hypothetical protein
MSGSNSSVRAGAPEAPGSDSPLAFTVHSLPQPRLDEAARRTTTGRVKMLLVLLVCAAPVIASYFTYFVIRPEGRTNYATLVLPQVPVPADLALSELDGRAVAPASLRDQWLLVVVAGGACDAACEKNLWLVRQLREAVGREKERITKLWIVDDLVPVRPEAASGFAQGGGARVLRAPAAAVSAWLQPAAGHRNVEHIHVVDPMGMWMMRTPASPDAARFKRDLERLLRASASWQANPPPRR